MIFQKTKRVLCLFLAFLLLFTAFLRPLEARATSIGAAAGLVGITVESAIPWLLSALSVSYLGTAAAELYPKIKAAVSDWVFTVGSTDYIRAYLYDSKYCFSSDVLAKVTTVSDAYLVDRYNTNSYANMLAMDWYDASNVHCSYITFSNNTPKCIYSEAAESIHFSCQLPAISFLKVGNNWTFYDDSKESGVGVSATYSCTAAPTVSDQKGDAVTRFKSMTASGAAIDIPAGAPTSTGKDKVYPIIDSFEIASDEVVDTDTKAEVSTSTPESADVSSILGWLEKIWSAIVSLPSSIASPIVSSVRAGIDSLLDFWSDAKTAIISIPEKLADIQEYIISLEHILVRFFDEDLPTVLLDVWEYCWSGAVSSIKKISATLDDVFMHISDASQTIKTAVVSALTQFWTDVKAAVLSIPDILVEIYSWIKSIPDILADVLSAVFVPSAGYLDAKMDALLADYKFLNNFKADINFIAARLKYLGASPPVIYIDLGASEGSYTLGGQIAFLDLSWYAKYKPSVDIILSAFLWLIFLWRLLLKLPGIISGLPGDFVMGGLNDFGLADHLPSRKAAYEIQRQSNREYIRKGGK